MRKAAATRDYLPLAYFILKAKSLSLYRHIAKTLRPLAVANPSLHQELLQQVSDLFLFF